MLYSFQQGLLNMPPKRDPERRLLLLPAEQIRKNPHRMRQSFPRAALSELMISIAQVGLIQPLTVREIPDGYELIAGERRLMACRLLGYREVPCIVVRVSEERSADRRWKRALSSTQNSFPYGSARAKTTSTAAAACCSRP